MDDNENDGGEANPPDYRQALTELASDFGDVQNEYKIKGKDRAVVARAKELGIYDWLVSVAPGLWGTSEDIARRLLEFDDRGMSQWLFYVGGPDVDRRDWIMQFGTEVMPAISRGTESRPELRR